jgi:5-methylcytosine-specific restriction protein A
MAEAKTARNPNWNRDEIILALALYKTNPASPPGKDSSQVAELSALLNKMHRIAGTTQSPTLRNANGVYMKMMNLRALDPAFVSQGKVGMSSGGQLEKVIWAEYAGQPAKLAADVGAIRDAVGSADEAKIATLPEAGEYVGEEGGVIMRLHKRYERDGKLVHKKVAEAVAKGCLECEVCRFDFEATYGEIGAGFIEVHHLKPVNQLGKGGKTKLSDLALLCANCHRMAHRKREPLGLNDIRKSIQSGGV